MRLYPNSMESAGKPHWNGLPVCNSKNIINKLVLTVFHNILHGRRPSTTCNQKDHKSYQEQSHHDSEPLIALRLRAVISRCCSFIHGALRSMGYLCSLAADPQCCSSAANHLRSVADREFIRSRANATKADAKPSQWTGSPCLPLTFQG